MMCNDLSAWLRDLSLPLVDSMRKELATTGTLMSFVERLLSKSVRSTNATQFEHSLSQLTVNPK